MSLSVSNPICNAVCVQKPLFKLFEIPLMSCVEIYVLEGCRVGEAGWLLGASRSLTKTTEMPGSLFGDIRIISSTGKQIHTETTTSKK